MLRPFFFARLSDNEWRLKACRAIVPLRSELIHKSHFTIKWIENRVTASERSEGMNWELCNAIWIHVTFNAKLIRIMGIVWGIANSTRLSWRISLLLGRPRRVCVFTIASPRFAHQNGKNRSSGKKKRKEKSVFIYGIARSGGDNEEACVTHKRQRKAIK